MLQQIIIVLAGEFARESGSWVLPEYRKRWEVPEPMYATDKFRVYWFKDACARTILEKHRK